jgi:tetratricopeptide (TPR) repeat protein
LQLAVIDPSSEQERELSSIAERLSIDNLLELLKLSDSMVAGVVFEETLKELWKVNRDPELRHKLDIGISYLLNGKKEKALVTFNELVAEDPTYAEAWNKVSTCQFMMGNMQSALEAAERTLILEPTHFQALNGLGLVQYETRRYRLAVDSFRQSLAIDPWSPVSSRLAACLDLVFDNIEETGEDDDEGAQEGTAPYQAKPR